jgi:hypothetical protein
MKRIVFTCKSEKVFKEVEEELIHDVRERWNNGDEEIKKAIEFEEDDEEIRVLIKETNM